MMSSFLIGLAGASGSGKSFLAYTLQKHYPEQVGVVHFDDYQKLEPEIPLLKGMRNWDHPDAIDFDRLYADLTALLAGKPVSIKTKSRVLNPEYEMAGRIQITISPKPIIIVEGYLSLYDPRILSLYHLKVYLDIAIENSIARRDKVTYNDEEAYNRLVLIPMHHAYVEPTKQHADLVIDVMTNHKDGAYAMFRRQLQLLGLL